MKLTPSLFHSAASANRPRAAVSSLVFLLLVCLGHAPLRAQSFTLAANQMEIAVATGFHHLPVLLPVFSSEPGFSPSVLNVSSSASWLTAAPDAGGAGLQLQFTTAALVSAVNTATLTVTWGAVSQSLVVTARVAALSVVHLADDPFRQRTYGIQQNGVNFGSVTVFDPVNTNNVGNVTVGRKPCDLAQSADGSLLYVINSVDESISVINLATLRVTRTIPLAQFDNWGASSTCAHIAVGPGDILYYTDGAWAPVLRVFNQVSGQVLQSFFAEGVGGSTGFGDIAVSPNGQRLFGWAQYGWSAGVLTSWLTAFQVQANGTLVFAEKTPGTYPNSLIERDPLNTPVLVSGDSSLVFVKKAVVSATAVNTPDKAYPAPVYSISPNAEVAATSTALYEHATQRKLSDLPVSTGVQCITSDMGSFVYFDSAARLIRSRRLLELTGPGVVSLGVEPADQAMVYSVSELKWPAIPGITRYRVYFGPVGSGVATATTASSTYKGEVTGAQYTPPVPVTARGSYEWRIDPVDEMGASKGFVHVFTVSPVVPDTRKVALAALPFGSASAQVRFDSQTPGETWTAVTAEDWIHLDQEQGQTPRTLTVFCEASDTVGTRVGHIVVSNAGGELFRVEVELKVLTLALTLLRSDPQSALVYGISEFSAGGGSPTSAYLLEINTATGQIDRMVPVGSTVTDLAIHAPENRIYVTNHKDGLLLALNRTTLALEATHAFNTGATNDGDVYRIAAGVAGRIMVEERDQWVQVRPYNTATSAYAGSGLSSVREGGGAYDPTGRYYFHGDNNSSGASLHKYDVTGDVLTQVANIRTSLFSYYGSRVILVSAQGNRVFWNGSVFTPALEEEYGTTSEIYSCSPDGRLAFGQTQIFDIDQRAAILGMPVDTKVSAYNGATGRLVLQKGTRLAFHLVGAPSTQPAPTLSPGLVTSTSVELLWDDNYLETGFTLQRRTLPSGAWTSLTAPARNATRQVVTGLSAGTQYEFRLRAEAAAGNSDWSGPLSVLTTPTPPSTPSLGVVRATFFEVLLTWTASNGAIGYTLERSDLSPVSWTTLATFSPGQTTLTDLTMLPGQTYQYRVKALGPFVDSGYSTVQVAVPAATVPASPEPLTALVVSTSRIELDWSPTDLTQGYRVERRLEPSSAWQPLADLPANQTTHVDTTGVRGESYTYRVLARNQVGDSLAALSATVTARPRVTLFSDDFDPVLDASVWLNVQGASSWTDSFRPSFSNILYFSGASARVAETSPVSLGEPSTLSFWVRAGNQAQQDIPWRDSEAGESVLVEYQAASGSWTALHTVDTAFPAASTWGHVVLELPPAARSASTSFRIRQLVHSGGGDDVWALEDIRLLQDLPGPPAAPPVAYTAVNSSTRITVIWLPSSGATGYQVERATLGTPWISLATNAASQTYWVDETVLPETDYYYRVLAVNGGGVSPATAPTYARTPSQIKDWVDQNALILGSAEPEALRGLDVDSVDFLHKFAFNLPAGASAWRMTPDGNSGLPVLWFDPGTRRMCAEFVRRRSDTHPGVAYHFQWADTVEGPWLDAQATTTITQLGTIWERVRMEEAEPPASGPRFTRVGLELLAAP